MQALTVERFFHFAWHEPCKCVLALCRHSIDSQIHFVCFNVCVNNCRWLSDVAMAADTACSASLGLFNRFRLSDDDTIVSLNVTPLFRTSLPSQFPISLGLLHKFGGFGSKVSS